MATTTRRPFRPAPPPYDPDPPAFALEPTAEIIRQIARAGRPIWSPYHGFGRLIGRIGHPPAFAHVAEYPQLPADRQIRPAHSGAFFILN